MVFVLILIAGSAVVGAVGFAALYDYRARRRGSRVSVSNQDASKGPREVEAALDPSREVRLAG